MATTDVAASIVVGFQTTSDDSLYLSAELDPVKNNEKTTFEPGDVIYIRVFHHPDLSYNGRCSSGHITFTDLDVVSYMPVEEVTFERSNTSAVAKVPVSIGSITWYGASGSIVPGVGAEVTAPEAPSDFVGICDLEYSSRYDVWKVTPPALGAMDNFKILVHFEQSYKRAK